MVNIDAIIELLSSDKTTLRKKGKDELEKALKLDLIYCVIESKHWWELLWNVLQWEHKDIQHACKKGQSVQSLYMNV